MGSHGHDDEHSDSIKGLEFHDQISNHQILEDDCAPWS